MKLSELEGSVTAAKAAEAKQNSYVQSLGLKIQAGEKTIKVFSDNVWTVVDLTAFWQIQYDKYMAMAAYSSKLDELSQKLQSELNDALLAIPAPPSDDDTVVA